MWIELEFLKNVRNYEFFEERESKLILPNRSILSTHKQLRLEKMLQLVENRVDSQDPIRTPCLLNNSYIESVGRDNFF